MQATVAVIVHTHTHNRLNANTVKHPRRELMRTQNSYEFNLIIDAAGRLQLFHSTSTTTTATTIVVVVVVVVIVIVLNCLMSTNRANFN